MAGRRGGKGSKSRSGISEAEVMRLKEIFIQYDQDGSGEITLKELQQFFNRTGTEMKELAADFLASVDKDGDGTITFFEMLKELYPYTSTSRLQAMVKLAFPEAPAKVVKQRQLTDDQLAEIRAIFSIYDRDGNGYIELEELKEALPDAGYEADEIEAMFHQYDEDKNGKMDQQEFINMMRDTFK